MPSGLTIGTGIGDIAGQFLPGGSALWGTAGGFLGGLFDKPTPPPAYKDQFDPTLTATAMQLRNSKLGRYWANRIGSNARRKAGIQYDRMENSPFAARNESTRAETFNELQSGAEDVAQGAQLRGAEQDLQSQREAAQIQHENQQLSYQKNMFDRGNYELSRVPSPLDAAMSTAFGLGLGKLIAPKLPTDKTEETTPPDPSADTMNGVPLPMPASPNVRIPKSQDFMQPIPEFSAPKMPDINTIGAKDSSLLDPSMLRQGAKSNYGWRDNFNGYGQNSNSTIPDYASEMWGRY